MYAELADAAFSFCGGIPLCPRNMLPPISVIGEIFGLEDPAMSLALGEFGGEISKYVARLPGISSLGGGKWPCCSSGVICEYTDETGRDNDACITG